MINAEQSISVHLLAVKSLNINGSALFMNSLLIDSMGRLEKVIMKGDLHWML